MSYEPVDFKIVDNTPAKNPIPGVVVKIYSQNQEQVFGQQLTDSSGEASFLLPSDVTYEVRFFKQQVNIKNPQLIEVLPAPETNEFIITGEPFVPPVSTNPRLCMCYGFFKTISGGPASNLDIHIISEFSPLLLDGAGVLTERIAHRTNRDGYVQIPLIRNGKYLVTLEGFEDVQRTISVPDALNVNLPDLLFPVVASVTFNPAIPASLVAGVDFITTPTVVATNGQVLVGTAIEDVIWDTEDGDIAIVSPSATTLTIRGLQAGTTNLRARRFNTSIIRIPDTGIAGVPVPLVIT